MGFSGLRRDQPILQRPRSGGGQRAVIVAMIAMRVMQVAADAIIDVIAMRHRLVTAAGRVDMAGFMTGAAVIRGAAIGVFAGNLNHVLVDMIAMRVMQVTVVEIVGVAVMAHGGVAATRPVTMRVAGVSRRGARGHFNRPFRFLEMRCGSRSRDRWRCAPTAARARQPARNRRAWPLAGASPDERRRASSGAPTRW